MIQHRYYDADDPELRPRFCWQTWLLWLIFVAGYLIWTYPHATHSHAAPVDWTRFDLRSAAVALTGLVLKFWIDLRIAYLRGM